MDDVYKAYKTMDEVVCVSQEAQVGFKEVIGDTGNLCTIYNMLPIDEIIRKSQQRPQMQVKRLNYMLC